MPQLDIIYALTIYAWTWLTITLISQKVKSTTLTIKPKNPDPTKNPQKTSTLPWT